MAVLWVGAEDCDYNSNASVSWITPGLRPGYDRGYFRTTGAGTADPNTVRITGGKWAAASSNFWLSMRLNASGNFIANAQWLAFNDPSGVRRLIFAANGNGSLKIVTRTAAGALTTVATLPWSPTTGVLNKIDINVVYGAAGSVTVFQNTVQVATYSGNIVSETATQLQSCDIGGCYTSGTQSWSEFFVADSDTRAMSVVTLTSSTAGDAQQWTGTPTNVNQNSLTNDNSFIYSATPDQVQQYKPGATLAGAFKVEALVQSARALIGPSGPQKLAFVTRVGSTDYVSPDYAPGLVFGSVQNIQANNPATSAAWSVSDLAAANLQYGLKSRA